MDPIHEDSSRMSTGTTIIAATFKDGVIVASDSRASAGSWVANRVTDKLELLYDRIYVCRSGSASDTQTIASYTRYYLDQFRTNYGLEPTVKNAATLLRRLIYDNKDNLTAGMIVAGWDDIEGPSVYSIPIEGSLIKDRIALGGSGSSYIYGFVDSNYRDNMTQEECLDFIRKAVQLAISRDGYSGGFVNTAVITKDGVVKTRMYEKDFIYH
ncbi:hypothetical protein WA158_003978 [Blastocystis sp. Blastoise]